MSASPARIGARHLGHQPRVVLVVGVDHHDDLGAVAQRPHVAGLLRRAVAAVGRVAEHVEAVARARRARLVGRRVVDQQRAVGGARPASRRRRRGSCASRCRPAGRRAPARPLPLLQQRLDRRAGPACGGRGSRARRRATGSRRDRRHPLRGGAQRPARAARAARRARRPSGVPRTCARTARRRRSRARARRSARAASAREQARCARAGSPTSARRRARAVDRRRVGRDDAQHAAGAQQPRAAVDRGDRIVEVLEHVGEHDRVELAGRVAVAALAERLQRQLADVEPERLARVPRRRRARARARRVS